MSEHDLESGTRPATFDEATSPPVAGVQEWRLRLHLAECRDCADEWDDTGNLSCEWEPAPTEIWTERKVIEDVDGIPSSTTFAEAPIVGGMFKKRRRHDV